MKKNIVFKAILRALTYHPDTIATPIFFDNEEIVLERSTKVQ